MKGESSIAIVGLGGIFPGAEDPDRLWQNIVSNVSAAREIPKGRWPLPVEDAYDSRIGRPDKVYSKKACFVDISSISLDTDLLKISPDFLSRLDPLVHLLLYAGQQAFLDAGAEMWDSSRIGAVFGNLVLPTDRASDLSWQILGRTFEEKVLVDMPIDDEAEVHPSNRYVAGLPAGILAKALGLGRGCRTLDAACASSLYALKLAVDELKTGRADAMLCGGVSRPSSLYTQMGFSQLHALSPTGTSAPFSRTGNGLVVGEGAGVFVLKRLDDAVRDRNRIYGVIRGIGLSNDVGGRLLAPTSEGQLRAMREAYEQAGWNPHDVDLVECHATGIPMGDAVEFESLQSLWQGGSRKRKKGAPGWEKGQCVIGSVKSNVGHLLTAAASASLMKVLLAIREKTLPPTANFQGAPPELEMEESPFRVLTEPLAWKPRKEDEPRRAAISAFGFGGINAHVLIEEWIDSRAVAKVFAQAPEPCPAEIAIVGMDTHFGPWTNLHAFQERVLGGRSSEFPLSTGRWWGAKQAGWFHEKGLSHIPFMGYYINEVSIPLDQFRIPPKEMEEMLPQQLLMLQVAIRAWRDARMNLQGDVKTGVFVGLGIDLNATNFHIRWLIKQQARSWNRKLNLGLSEAELDEWVQVLRDASGPALTANRTMGALGSVVASRIARELRLGGPSFTLSAEESSGIHALRAGVQALKDRSIDAALVGAVDLAGDIRSVLSTHAGRPFSNTGETRPFDIATKGALIGEGAAAVLLKRLEDALSDGDRIYAVIKGIGVASGGHAESPCPDAEAYQAALELAYAEAGVSPDSIGYIDAHGSGSPVEDDMEAEALAAGFRNTTPQSHTGGSAFGNRACALGSVKGDIGHTGAASGLASIVKACLCLYQEMLPPLRNIKNAQTRLMDEGCCLYIPKKPQYWLHNRAEGPRRAGVSSFSIDGNCTHVVLEALKPETQESVCTPSVLSQIQEEKNYPLGAIREALFTVTGDSVEDLLEGLDRLRAFVDKHAHLVLNHIDELGRTWWERRKSDPLHGKAVVLIARTVTELLKQISFARTSIGEDPGRALGGRGGPLPQAFAGDRIFYNPEPLRPAEPGAGRIAFVFPGSGSQYSEMGRDLFVQWPMILRNQHVENQYLRSQFQPGCFWNPDAWTEERLQQTLNSHKTMMLGQVALSTAVSDLVRYFGIQPDAVIGYSLGETAGLFALGAWRDRDGMLERIEKTTLFTNELAGEFNAARKTWKLQPREAVDWVLGVIDRPMGTLKTAIKNHKFIYGLITNTLHECVVGGTRKAVESLVDMLQCEYIPINGVTTAHCEIVKEVEKPYRELHLFDTTPAEGLRFYSGAWGKAYDVNRESAADAILAHAVQGVDFPKTIEAAYGHGVRFFIEVGPGASCSRMISNILAGRPHLARSVCYPGQDAASLVLRCLGHLVAERVPVNLGALYNRERNRTIKEKVTRDKNDNELIIPVGGEPFKVPVRLHMRALSPEPLPLADPDEVPTTPSLPERSPAPLLSVASAMPVLPVPDALVNQFQRSETARAEAHEMFLNFSADVTRMMSENISMQLALSKVHPAGVRLDTPAPVTSEKAQVSSPVFPAPVFLAREQCMEFAVGRVGNVFGPKYGEADTFPTRVRLPDEPLMLVDRVVTLEGEPLSLTCGRIVTEHDVWPNSWYLDGGRTPVCIAVEAGQADLMLSGYLGIDFKSRGLARYRLLDAQVAFHRHLPKPGEVIRYDIRIERFFVHNGIYFFRFRFDGTINNEPLITMREGCAGFFTDEDLDAGKGIVLTELDKAPASGKYTGGFEAPVPMEKEAYDETRVEALRNGDLESAFGPLFQNLTLGEAQRLPGGRMRLVHRVIELDPQGGRYSMGMIRAEADIDPADWFLTCHFMDDRVMPGTLMYECCMHTLRIFLMRMGWITEAEDEGAYEPVLDLTSVLKCRGQVLETTKVVTYEVAIKELGYGPEPYAIADARMYADGKHIVDIENMSIRFSDLDQDKIRALWRGRESKQEETRPVHYGRDKILAFAQGRPSEAFGDRYLPFDNDRQIARLPGPPYSFLDSIRPLAGEPWVMKAGAAAEAFYAIPEDAWYFDANRQADMPYAVLLEIALQPCGWLAAYMGSALTSDEDLCFRNLGGDAMQYLAVRPDSGRLAITTKVTSVSSSGGMIIQDYAFEVQSPAGTVFKGTTNFGFFSKRALQQQKGVQNAERYLPDPDELEAAESFPYPGEAPFPDAQMRMIREIDFYHFAGGTRGLGFIRGSKAVDPEEWFFAAHFFQDPVIPGSLGLEAFVQLLKVAAAKRWGVAPATRLRGVALGEPHQWIYRGQVIPANRQVIVEADITEIDEARRKIRADGYLLVDGMVIYKMTGFTLEMDGRDS
ncbi:MAG: beta-ketoacyl synthase N-terminal-like domain-containing protein [Planctomycetota bacterium]